MSAERYWELRWRDEHAANEALRDEIARLRAGLKSIVDCVNPLPRAAVREACAEILAGASALSSQEPKA